MSQQVAVEEIAHRIAASVDGDWRARMRDQMARLHGVKSTTANLGHVEGPCNWKVYPAIHRGTEEVGTVQDTLNDAINQMSRLMSVDPEPKFSGIKDLDAQVRLAFYKERYNDHRKGGSWHMANLATMLSGYLLGLGVSRLQLVTDTAYETDRSRGLRRGRKTQRSAMMNHPLLQTVYDVHALDPWQSDYVAYLDLMPLRVATKRWPKHAELLETLAKTWTKSLDTNAALHQGVKVVPVIEYWSCGANDDMPTRAVLVGTGTGVTALEYGENPLGEMTNVSWRVGTLMTEAGYPMGRASLAESWEELLQIVLDDIKKTAERGGAVRIIHNGALSPTDIERLKSGSGDPILVLEATKDVKDMDVNRIMTTLSHMPVNPALDPLLQMGERRQQRALNMTDAGRGQFGPRQTTATATALLQQNMLANNGLDTYMTLKCLAGQVRIWETMVRKWDTSPVLLNVLGEQVLFNDPAEPSSMADVWFAERANVLVDAASLTGQDDVSRRAAQIGEHQQLFPLVQMGLVSPDWYTQAYLSKMGVFDPAARAKAQPAPTAGPQGAGMTPPGAGAAPVQANV